MVSFESFFCLKDVPIMLLFYEIIIIFLIMANLGQCGSMQNTWYIARNFPLIATFYLAKPENRAINIQYTTHPSCYCFEKRFYFYLKMLTSCKKCWSQQSLGIFGTIKIIFWNHLWLCSYMSSFKFLA